MVIVLGVLAVNVLNLYGAFMSITTTLEAFTKLKATTKVRFWLVFATAIIGTALAIWGNGNFLWEGIFKNSNIVLIFRNIL
ncbi:hypothetical protein IEC97_21550 [Neobacillus cucumis]|uniref:hypothetical protein n=1 Tax=Neobacillus cucumis TaxID=1740721 RepID=UPI0018DFF600|nr:hypothetical protein [Neobacillus cucumis]MBI0579949.1 hypothetical protein [Neobacillus cucumis]